MLRASMARAVPEAAAANASRLVKLGKGEAGWAPGELEVMV